MYNHVVCLFWLFFSGQYLKLINYIIIILSTGLTLIIFWLSLKITSQANPATPKSKFTRTQSKNQAEKRASTYTETPGEVYVLAPGSANVEQKTSGEAKHVDLQQCFFFLQHDLLCTILWFVFLWCDWCMVFLFLFFFVVVFGGGACCWWWRWWLSFSWSKALGCSRVGST